MNRTGLAIVVGLLLGITFVAFGFGDMLIVALFGAIGYGVVKVASGEIDLAELLSRGRSGQ